MSEILVSENRSAVIILEIDTNVGYLDGFRQSRVLEKSTGERNWAEQTPPIRPTERQLLFKNSRRRRSESPQWRGYCSGKKRAPSKMFGMALNGHFGTFPISHSDSKVVSTPKEDPNRHK